MTEKELKKYKGYSPIDQEIKRKIDELRKQFPEKFEGVLETTRRGYRWMVNFGDIREIRIKKQPDENGNEWIRFSLDYFIEKEGKLDDKKS